MNLDGISKFNQARIEWAIRLRYSPMPELDMEWVCTQLNAHRIGDFRNIGKTWEVMMERDAELAVNADKRCSDVASLDWAIQSDGSPDGDDHARALKYFYEHLTATEALDQDDVGGLRKLIKQTMSALSYRHSMSEMLLRIDNPSAKEVTAEFRHTPIWFFEARRGYLGYLQHIFDLYGQPCMSGEWLTAVGPGWMRPLSIAFVMKHFPLRDWLLFCTRYGIGFLDGETNAQRGSPEWDALDEGLRTLANDGVLLHNPLTGDKAGLAVRFLDQANKNNIPMQPLVEWVNRLYAKVYRGIDMATGGHTGGEQSRARATGAIVQREESGIFLADDANWTSETFQNRIDRPIIAYLFNREPRAKFILEPEADDNSTADLAAVEALVPLGLEIAKEEARKRFNWREPEDGEPILLAAQQPMGTKPGNLTEGNQDNEGRPEGNANRGDQGNGKPNENGDGSAGASPYQAPGSPGVYKKPAWKKAGTRGAPSIAAETDDKTPIAPGADPRRQVQTSNPDMPDPQVDSAGFYSRAGLAPAPARPRTTDYGPQATRAYTPTLLGADGKPLPIPSMAWAVPNDHPGEIAKTSHGVNGLLTTSKNLLLEAIASEFADINRRLEAASRITDPETQKRKLAAILADLDKLAKDSQGDPDVARALYRILSAGIANGIAGSQKETKEGGKS